MTMQAPAQFPNLADEVRHLVDEHRQLADEPLLLAIYYKPAREPQDVFLLEVIENFGDGAVDPDRELFEVTYRSTSGFPLAPGQQLHLVLTNPREFERAVRENWPAVAELRRAIQAGDFRTLHTAPDRADLRGLVDA